MKFTGIQLVICCDDLEAGAQEVLGLSHAECPSWCLVTKDERVIARTPVNIPVVRVKTAKHLTLAQIAYEDRRRFGHACGLDKAMLDRLASWKERREDKLAEMVAAYVEADRQEAGF